MGGETIIDIDQRLPLKELQDIYDSRGRKRGRTRVSSDVTWEDVLPKLEYPFAERALRLCRNEKEGDPARRRFVSFRSNMHGYTWIIVNFNYKYLNIYMKGKPSNAEDEIRKVFGEDTAISTWREGHSFKVETGAQFEALVSWLKMKDVPTE
jgi:hypothetical protein